jgi:WD40 repeat protein/class 3 adenylate cyclase
MEVAMLQIRLLGQFDVRLDGKRILIPSRAGQSLLAYLVLTPGTPHRREKLGGILWPDFSEETARKNLRHELWRIRKAISTQQPTAPGYLQAEEFTIAFNRQTEHWLDVAQMERPELDLGSLISNLALYQGELLPGFYEDWIVLERERIRVIFDTKMEQLLGQLIAAERWTAVQEQAERWLSLGNALEPAYRALMLACGARGDMARVSSIYQRCMKQLDEQFGLEPSAETRALYDGLLKGAHMPARAVQSSSTVTFLFTDIEESTHLLDQLRDQYPAVLAIHHEILRTAVQKWNGTEIATQGDAFFVTFARSLDAVQCAADAQRALAAYEWPHDQPLRVRMGLHTGEPLIASTGYVGMDVHRAARIGDAAHGGQVLLSQTTRELVWHDLPNGLTVRDLGEHRLKDLKFPTPIYQLVIEGLSYDFPPLRTRFTGAEAPTPGEPPFKGLQYFDELDSELFFGRELLTARLVDRLHRLPSASEEVESGMRFLSVVIGASGSGKSSLVRAGLIPALKKGQPLADGTKPPEGSAHWQVYTLAPTMHPLQALATELTRESESVTAAATLMDDLTQDPRSLSLFLARQHPREHTLLVLDQFEELFTLCRDEFERETFIDNLLTSLHQGAGKITLILTLRADFYAHLAQYPELRDAVAKQQEYIGPMTAEELRRAIEEPAKRGHWVFEPGLVDLILRDVGDEPGALPLLSHALLETWKRRAGHTLTLKGYADAGGVRGAIAHTAESVYQKLSSVEQTIARNIFLRLTELGEGTEDTRRRASFDELISDAESEHVDGARSMLNTLADARLVTLGEDTAEVAHEALIREWPALREWLNQDRESLRLHRHLTEAAHEWELLERDAGALYRGSHLAQAREWAMMHPNQLNAAEKTFLEASDTFEQHEAREREEQQSRELEAAQRLAETENARAEEQAQSVKRLRKRGVFLASALALAVVAALFAVVFARNSQQQALVSEVRELSNAANLNLAIDPERSILLGLQAVNKTYAIDRSVMPEAEDALHRAVQASRVELTLRGHADVLWSAVFSADGTRIATASADGTAKIWDASTGKELLSVDGSEYGTGSEEGYVWYAAFSPDGKWIATAAGDDLARIWDVSTGEELFELTGHHDDVFHIEFSPDGSRLATVSPDGTAKVWDALTGKELLTVDQGDGARPYWVTFSPDGSQIAVANTADTSQGWASIWDAVTGELLLALPHQNAYFASVSFSPDGTHLLTTSDDGAVRVWDVNDGKELLTLYGQTANVANAAYSPDGTRVVTTTGNNQVKVLEAATGRELLTVAGHSRGVRTVGFSPDGARIVTASDDGTARVWNISPGREFLTMVNGPAITHPIGASLAYNPDGTRLAVSYSDPTARVWDATTGKLLLSLAGHTDAVNHIAYNLDGTRIATAARDGTAKIWDANSGKELLTLSGHKDWVLGVAFSPDGARIATCSFDGTAMVWDLQTGEKVLTLNGHRDWVVSVVFSPDASRIAASSFDTTARVWDAVTGKELLTLTGHTGTVRQVVFSPDGTRLATSSFDGTVRVWDAVSGDELFTLPGPITGLFRVVFSPDGKTIATAGSDATLWDARSGEELLTLYMPESLTSVAFSPDGSQLAAASRDGTNRIYLLKIEDLMALAKSRLTRALTAEECQEYLHAATCPPVP